jgi:hypothetical protein
MHGAPWSAHDMLTAVMWPVQQAAAPTHNAAARASPGIVLAGCWAHIFSGSQKPSHISPTRS